MYIQVYIVRWTNEKKKEIKNEKFRLHLVLYIQIGLEGCISLLIHAEGLVYKQSRLWSYTPIVDVWLETTVKSRITIFETIWDWPIRIIDSLLKFIETDDNDNNDSLLFRTIYAIVLLFVTTAATTSFFLYFFSCHCYRLPRHLVIRIAQWS